MPGRGEHEPRHIRASKGRWLSVRMRTQRRGPRQLHLPQAGAQEGAAGVAVLVGWESLCSRHQANVLPSLGAPGR